MNENQIDTDQLSDGLSLREFSDDGSESTRIIRRDMAVSITRILLLNCRLIGPNCQGVSCKIHPSFTPSRVDPFL